MVPRPVVALIALCVLLQLMLVAGQPRPLARASALPPPPSGPGLTLIRHFEPLPSAHLLTLYLQAYDNQPGISIPFRDLDYSRVGEWLRTILGLDPAGQYPLLMATQLYAQVPDPPRQRYMLDLAYEQFLIDPNRRWPWLAHGAIMAKHRLSDLPLALKFARAVAEYSTRAPSWARQMHIFLLEDMGEFEAARILLGGLLASGTVTDRHERILLLESLERVKAAENSAGVTRR
ncbi:MAG: hypothetical protein EHM59_14545 [Betaproteobacteria bacterium]|nr:MAG: hypothetical protein EHM59_14545 [Betaproteobacteria bacterium]